MRPFQAVQRLGCVPVTRYRTALRVASGIKAGGHATGFVVCNVFCPHHAIVWFHLTRATMPQ
ncbi:hypothetical protein WM40_01065 [Robbsia andropogonis]|uniref:Uncharacterized protein n=1 Tax=Robbsia andropogonis TaxID=28092 RepID=A0A0F5K5W5_9BURK|nr:hypothetical protein WM40_01065 [Robbsia andropogonis]